MQRISKKYYYAVYPSLGIILKPKVVAWKAKGAFKPAAKERCVLPRFKMTSESHVVMAGEGRCRPHQTKWMS
jgi:hypothetical protein